MTNRRKVIPVLAALLVLLAGCGQLSTSSEQDGAFALTEVATQALSWSIDTLDVDGWIYGPTAMAMGSDGTRHIAFVESYDDVVMYVSDETGSWSAPETVGSSNALAVSMAIDSQDVPHVSYVERDNSVAYATRADGDWPTPADTVSPYATEVSLALDDSGTAHLAYMDSNGLQYALRTSEGWSASTVLADTATGDVMSGALALDREGHPHVAVMWIEYVAPFLSLRLGYAEATYDADGKISWQPLTLIAVYDSPTTTGSVALALDGSDHPHIAYRSGSRTLKYVRHDGSGWGKPETVHAGESFEPSIAVDSSGNPHVAFLVQPVQYGAHTVYYGMRSDTGWSTDVVDDKGNAGPASLALDASGQPHISYSYNDGSRGTLKVATVASAPSDTSPPVITPNVVGTVGDNGWYVGDVGVTWSVVDDESDIASTSGCDATTIASDTTGSTLTCAATSAGGTESRSVTITRDATAPVVSVTGVADDATYPLGSVPSAGCSTSDPTSGVAQFATVSLAGGPTGAITASCLGAKDLAGNAGSASVTYHVVEVVDPSAATESLIDDVERLSAEGVLNAGQAKGLIKPLANALRSLKKGYTLDACNQLGDFIVGVEAKVPPLTVAQADDLIGSAEAIREMLGCP